MGRVKKARSCPWPPAWPADAPAGGPILPRRELAVPATEIIDRRGFGRGLLAAGLAAPAILGPRSALAFESDDDNDDNDSRDIARVARVRLRMLSTAVLLTWFLIYLRGGGLFGLDLTRPVPQFRENRANLSRIPLIGGSQRPLLADRFAGAGLVGPLVVLGTFLILLSTVNVNFRNRKVVIANRDRSWEPEGSPVPVLAEIPVFGELFSSRHVGSGLMKGNELVALVTPHIIRGLDDG